MNIKSFEGSGSTPIRRKFWSDVYKFVLGARKLAGRHVKVREFPNKGTVIDLLDEAARGRGEGLGGCCVDGECSILSPSDCAAAGGHYLGNGSNCTDVDCTHGACCQDGFCSYVVPGDCAGEYQGDGTSCATVNCGIATSGACCVGEACSVISPHSCGLAGGTYQGDNTTCSPNPCSTAETGACCHNGDCSIQTEADCVAAGGTYQGNDTSCDDEGLDCGNETTGACCVDTDCSADETPNSCEALGGEYQGDNTTCDSVDCNAASGACCSSDGFCHVQTEDACVASGGTYRGDDVPCDSTCSDCFTETAGHDCPGCVLDCGPHFPPHLNEIVCIDASAYSCCVRGGICTRAGCDECAVFQNPFDGSCWMMSGAHALCQANTLGGWPLDPGCTPCCLVSSECL